MEEQKGYTFDLFGNIIELAGELKAYNIITANDSIDVVKEKTRKQLEMLAELRAKEKEKK
jgi:hypothetical protein